MMKRILLLLFSFVFMSLSMAQSDQDMPQPLFALEHAGVVPDAAWNPAGDQIATASEDGSLRLWEAATGEQLRREDFESPVRGLRWSPDGQMIAFWTDSGEVRYLDLDAGTLSSPLPTNGGFIGGVSWRADGGVLLVWDEFAVYAPTLRGADWSASVFMLNHDSRLLSVDWSADGSHVYSFTEAGDALVWDASSGEQVQSQSFGRDALGAVWNADETRLVVLGLRGSAILVDLESRRRTDLTHRTFVNGARFSQDESRIMTWAADDRVKLWDADGRELLTLLHNDWVQGALWDRSETRVLSWAFNTVWLWDAGTGALLARFPHENIVNGGAFNPTQERLLTWGWDGMAYVWDISGLMAESASN